MFTKSITDSLFPFVVAMLFSTSFAAYTQAADPEKKKEKTLEEALKGYKGTQKGFPGEAESVWTITKDNVGGPVRLKLQKNASATILIPAGTTVERITVPRITDGKPEIHPENKPMSVLEMTLDRFMVKGVPDSFQRIKKGRDGKIEVNHAVETPDTEGAKGLYAQVSGGKVLFIFNLDKPK